MPTNPEPPTREALPTPTKPPPTEPEPGDREALPRRLVEPTHRQAPQSERPRWN